jgi:hypothetical protein
MKILKRIDVKNDKLEFGQHQQKSIKQLTKEWAGSTTAHGFRNIVSRKTIFSRIFWSIAIMCSLAYCCYEIINTIILYKKYDVNTSIKLITETPTNYPVVDICNLNAYNGFYVKDVLTQDVLTENFTINQGEFSKFDIELVMKQINSLTKRSALRSPLFEYGYFLDEILISCSFKGIPCNMNEDFDWYYDFNYGTCFSFNSGYQKTRDTSSIRFRNKVFFVSFIFNKSINEII